MGWDSECVNLINAETKESLSNRAEILFKKGRVYLVRPEDRKRDIEEIETSTNQENEIQIFVAYNPNEHESNKKENNNEIFM